MSVTPPPASPFTVPFEGGLRVAAHAGAPWFAGPADDEPCTRLAVTRIVVATPRALPPRRSRKPPEELAPFERHIQTLEQEDS